MYEEIYKLTGNPFKLTPDPEFFYPSRTHKKVMAYLQYGVEQGDGFIVVTGNIGTGKTTIIQALLNELKEDSDILVAQLTSTQLDENDLLQMIASSFGLPGEGMSKAALLNNLEKFLRQKYSENKRVLLIVDEAQNMPDRSLEELRMLSNYQQDGRPLFQSFLIGQEQFKKIINRKDMEQLKQRVIASYHLDALDAEETRHYIEYRLECVGWKKDPEFNKEAFNRIFEYTGGVPRRINIFCDRLMLYAAMSELHKINIKTVEEVVAEFGEETTEAPREKLTLKKKKKNRSGGKGNKNKDEGSLEERVRHLERKLNRLEDIMESLLDIYELD